MPANFTIAHAVRSTRSSQPLELIYATPLLLTETCFPEPAGFAMGLRVETLAIRATLITMTLSEIPGYRHIGIND